MDFAQLMDVIKSNAWYAAGLVLGLCLLSYLVVQFILVRLGRHLVKRTATRADDIIVKHLHLKRLALIAPLLVILASASLFPPAADKVIVAISALVITWLIALSLVSLFKGINTAYESRPSYNGVSIKGFMDILKLVAVLVAVIITVSILVDQSPLVLLAGLGAVAAVLMLIFQNTILSLVATVQIMTNDLLREGDFIDVPSFQANGTVSAISLTTIKVRNADMTYSHIPTYKILDTAFINWRGMNESESRRIKRAIILDQFSIKACDGQLLERLAQDERLSAFMAARTLETDPARQTNSALLREYLLHYLKSREDIIQEGKSLLVRLLAPDQNGMPLEVIAFTRTTDWMAYEAIQAEIFEHILSVLAAFDLRVSQQWALQPPVAKG